MLSILQFQYKARRPVIAADLSQVKRHIDLGCRLTLLIGLQDELFLVLWQKENRHL